MEGTKINLWKHATKDGKGYLSGPMSRVSRLIVVENDKKEDPQDPDFYAYIVPNRGVGQGAAHVEGL
jgi:hypothetical protein